MAVRDVLRYPDPALKQVARCVPDHELELALTVATDLADTMDAYRGCVGLAAPQVGEPVRVVVVDVTGHPRATACNGRLLLVNPLIRDASGAETAREGCLSIPDLTANVRRATEIRVEATTPAGDPLTVSSSGFEARCLQH